MLILRYQYVATCVIPGHGIRADTAMQSALCMYALKLLCGRAYSGNIDAVRNDEGFRLFHVIRPVLVWVLFPYLYSGCAVKRVCKITRAEGAQIQFTLQPGLRVPYLIASLHFHSHFALTCPLCPWLTKRFIGPSARRSTSARQT